MRIGCLVVTALTVLLLLVPAIIGLWERRLGQAAVFFSGALAAMGAGMLFLRLVEKMDREHEARRVRFAAEMAAEAAEEEAEEAERAAHPPPPRPLPRGPIEMRGTSRWVAYCVLAGIAMLPLAWLFMTSPAVLGLPWINRSAAAGLIVATAVVAFCALRDGNPKFRADATGIEEKRSFLGYLEKRSGVLWKQVGRVVLVIRHSKKRMGHTQSKLARAAENYPDRYIVLYDSARQELMRIPEPLFAREKLDEMAAAIATWTGTKVEGEVR